MTIERPTIEKQASFTDGGQIETDDEPSDTGLDDWGLDVGENRESKPDVPQASSLLNDDRPTEESEADSEQEPFFPDVSDGQIDLNGEVYGRLKTCDFDGGADD